MALYDPMFGEGTVLSVNDGAADAFAELDNYISITPPNTHHAKVARRVLRKAMVLNRVSPIIEYGDLGLVYETSKEVHARMEALRNVEKTYTIVYMDGRKFSFKAILYMHDPGGIQDGNTIVTNAATLVVTSVITFSNATAPTLPALPT